MFFVRKPNVISLALISFALVLSTVQNISVAHATTLTCAQGGECIVGDTGPGGGLVFFVKSTGIFNVSYTEPGFFGATYTVALTSTQQSALTFDYLEVAPTGRGLGTWGLDGTTTNGTSRTIGSGPTNTSNILLTQVGPTSSNAARYADEYENNGYSDWYLPAFDEILLMMLRVKLGTFTADNFPLALWSSSDNTATTAAMRSRLSQLVGYVNRSLPSGGVRPVRSFSASTSPSAPTLNTVTGGDRSISVAFTAGANGGASIIDYEYSLNGGTYVSAATTTSPFTITSGISGRTSYSVTLKARNSVGLGSASGSLSATTTDSSADASEAAAAAAEAARVAAVNAAIAAAAAKRAADQKEMSELLAVLPSIAGLALNIGDLTNSLLAKQKCVNGKKTKTVSYGSKCPKGYVKGK